MTFDTQGAFDLAQGWLNCRNINAQVAQQAAIRAQIVALGLNPECMNLPESVRRQNLHNLEALRLAFHRNVAALGRFTLVAPNVSSYLSETGGAYVLDTMGLGRKGKAPQNQNLPPHDLVNMYEVKENQRAFANIDITFYGTPLVIGGSTWVEVDQTQTDPRYVSQLNGDYWRITNQINGSRGSLLQPISAAGIYSGPGVKTRTSKTQISKVINGRLHNWVSPQGSSSGQWDIRGSRRGNFPQGDGLYVRLSRGLRVNSGPSWFILRQESGNVNLGEHSGFEHAMTLHNGLLYVSRHRDVEGRCCISYIRVKFDTLSGAEHYMGSQRPLTDRYQLQPYLFNDNTRDEYYSMTSPKSIARMGGKLLAHYIETDTGLEEAFWDPIGVALTDPTIEQMMLTGTPFSSRKRTLSPDWQSVPTFNATNRTTMEQTYLDSLCSFYRSSRFYTDQTNTARNIFTGKESEHLASLAFGLRGDRSTARGVDLIDDANGLESEVKQVSAQRGDAMFTLDPAPPVNNINRNTANMDRLFIGRIFDQVMNNGVNRLHIKLQYMNITPTISAQIAQYFAQYSSSPNFQYHSGTYASNQYGSVARRIIPSVKYEYIE